MGTDNNNTNIQITLVDVKAVRLAIADRTLIQDFTLRLESGERIGITGPSGCGKTTMLRSIVGRRLPAWSDAERFKVTSHRIGYMPQQGGMLPWFSLRRNLSVFAASDETTKASWCDDVLAKMELSEVGATFPEQLSGGEMQRARLACAIAARPYLYCADEPLTEVGLQQKWRLLERWSSEMSKRNSSLLLVSHDIDTLIYLCDEVIVLGETVGQPARVITQFDMPGKPHPRNPADLSCSSLEAVRNQMIKALYLPHLGLPEQRMI